jgi:fructosamine-3-kinase
MVAARTAIPMPEVLAVDVSYRLWPWRYFIKTHITGEEWVTARERMNAEELADAYRQLGNAVAQLHTIHFAAFGELSVAGEAIKGTSYLPALAERARNFIKSARLRALFLSVLDQHERLFVDIHTPSLCHEDLHQHNILFQQRQGKWHLATILDFDKAWAGHHETDLARLEFWRGMTSREFWQAYEAICPIEPLFSQRRLIYQLLWCFEYARSTPEHIADTQRLCAALGLPRLEQY